MQQVMKTWDAKDFTMVAYCAAVHRLEGHFECLKLHHVRWEHNKATNSLSRIGSTHQKIPLGIFLQQLHQRSVKVQSATNSSESESQGSGSSDSVEEGVLVVIPLWTQLYLAS